MGFSNHDKAWDYFISIGAIPEERTERWVLHHKDPSWKTEDPERYEQWNIEDLIPMTRSEHSKLHHIGKHSSEESKQKNREAHLGKRHTEETCKKISESNSGENHPMYGKHHSEETKQKIRDSSNNEGQNNPMYGKNHSEETKQKMREAKKKKKIDKIVKYYEGRRCIE